MPILPISQEFRTSPFGVVTSYLQGNVGDLIFAEYVFEESIAVTSGSSETITTGGVSGILTWLGGDWEVEGFRPNDTVDIVVFEVQTGTVLDSVTTQVVWVNEDEMKVVNNVTQWYSFPDSACSVTNRRNREGVQIDFNMVANGSTGTQYSLIDGEVTRFLCDLQIPAVPVVNQVGNQSGAYVQNLTIGLLSSGGGINRYQLNIEFVISGLYNESLYSFDNCLKPFIQMSWQSLIGEPFNNYNAILSDDANTGWFDEAFNVGVIDATLVTGVSELNYDTPTTYTFVIDSSTPQANNFALGGAYISGDDDYYKVQAESQINLTMLIYSFLPITGTPIQSATNPQGADYTITPISVTTVGTIHTIECTFTPGVNFASFMGSRADGDRLFYLWAKWGNQNLLIFSGQLQSQPAVVQQHSLNVLGYLDHSENVQNVASGKATGYSANIEDDLSFVAQWRFPANVNVTYLRVGVEAWNFTSGETFTLQQNSFSFANIPQDNTSLGAYILNESIPVNTELPTTSAKREITLVNYPLLNTANEYGVKLYFAWLYKWQYWIELANANVDFYPNEQTQNWLPYGTTGDWRVRVFIEHDRNGEAYEFRQEVEIKDYDDNPDILQAIELYRNNPLQQVQVLIEDEIMRVVGTHTLVPGNAWVQDEVWAMITIEATESSPRYICSTVVPFDNNPLNPLTPLTGNFCDLTFPSADVARTECFLDTSKLDLTNGAKITIKIKGCATTPPNYKITTSGDIKKTTSGDNKILA